MAIRGGVVELNGSSKSRVVAADIEAPAAPTAAENPSSMEGDDPPL